MGTIRLLAISVLLLCPLFAQSQQLQLKAETAKAPEMILDHYVQLRLGNADWKDYSAFITWPDEPSWDCKWVTEKYDIKPAKRAVKGRIIIPVVFKRVGLFCYDLEFSPGPKDVTVNYELVKRPNGWKIDAPIPDYPDISADVLKKSLAARAENPGESPERRAQFAATLRKLSDSLAHQHR
jgi:hypothetical protein